MDKSIYLGNGLMEQIKHFCEPKQYTKEILKYTKEHPLTNNYFIMMGSKQYEIYKLIQEKESKQIDPDLADLKIDAIYSNAYLYPGWNYLKYPKADLSFGYDRHSFTNEIFEEIGEDEYEDPILIFVGREGNL